MFTYLLLHKLSLMDREARNSHMGILEQTPHSCVSAFFSYVFSPNKRYTPALTYHRENSYTPSCMQPQASSCVGYHCMYAFSTNRYTQTVCGYSRTTNHAYSFQEHNCVHFQAHSHTVLKACLYAFLGEQPLSFRNMPACILVRTAALLYDVHRSCAEAAAVSRGTSHVD